MANNVNLLLIVIVAKIHIYEGCVGGSECPTQKPFCSSAGCVEECPEPFYKNNTECVLNCGDMFVGEDMTCEQACSEKDFIENTLKFAGQEFIERKCVRSCPSFILNNTCTQSCHMQSNVVISDDLNMAKPGKRFCVEQCPDTHAYKTNVTYGTKSVAFCSKECDFVIENGYCVINCSEGYVIFNRTCIASCPKSHPVKNQRGECKELCTAINFENSTCDCPQNMSYIQNKTCVSECSPSLFTKYRINRNFCVQSCDLGDKLLNKMCVKGCDITMIEFEGQCLERCPEGYRNSFQDTCIKDSDVIIAMIVILATLAVCVYNHRIFMDFHYYLSIRDRSRGVPDFLKILEQPEPFEIEIDDDTVPLMFQNSDVNDVMMMSLHCSLKN